MRRARRSCGAALLAGVLALADGRRRPPARQLLDQPPDARCGVRRPRRRRATCSTRRRSRRSRARADSHAEVLRAQAGRGRARAARSPSTGGRCRCGSRRAGGSRSRDGQGGLRTTRVSCTLTRAGRERRGASSCATTRSPAASAGRRSSRSPGEGTAVRSSVPSEDPTGGLRAYPQDAAESPARPARRDASRRGPATARCRAARRAAAARRRRAASRRRLRRRCSTTPRPVRACCSCCCSPRSAGARCTRCRPATARRWSRRTSSARAGRARHAVALGATVTITHTIGVFALGFVDARPVAVHPAGGPVPVAEPRVRAAGGAASARACCARGCGRGARTAIAHDHHHSPRPRITRPRPLASHGHAPHAPEHRWKGVIAMGASAGLIPCPSALVVLLGAIAQHQVALGNAADRRVQPRPGRDADRPRPGGRLRARAAEPRDWCPGAWCASLPAASAVVDRRSSAAC